MVVGQQSTDTAEPSKNILGLSFREYPELLRGNNFLGISLEVQWLGLKAFTADGAGSISGQGTRIPQPHGVAKKPPQKVAYLIFGTFSVTPFWLNWIKFAC